MSANAIPKSSMLQNQSGAALMVGLVLLLILTILGITILQVTLMQERMARNLRDQNIAFQAAEAALRAGEAEINNATGAPFNPFNFDTFAANPACTTSYRCLPDLSGTPRWESVAWTSTSTNTNAVPVALTLPGGTPRQPRYLIELLTGKPTFDPSLGCTPAVFRVSARGYGPSSAEAHLQTIFRFKPAAC